MRLASRITVTWPSGSLTAAKGVTEPGSTPSAARSAAAGRDGVAAPVQGDRRLGIVDRRKGRDGARLDAQRRAQLLGRPEGDPARGPARLGPPAPRARPPGPPGAA